MNVSFSSSFSHQKGIGLIEVMIALLLLAVAVLGFSAMQMTAVKATDESLMRTRALTVMRGGAEMMRANPKGILAFKSALNTTANSTVSSVGSINASSCMGNNSCTIDQLATRDAITVTNHAKQSDMKIAMTTCPGTVGQQERQCFITSWETTTPEFSDTSPTACATSTTATYKSGAKCFIMEAY